ncbi:MFS transporter [Geomesophilobacter sediminis]|uniref:MFS transporter n=1 Tax=Geomesophilobacter sediminis TaxID=2798584 RepID=A0A8J7JB76_9BACT|nr:MFS transporter [Geomesophilobacter sediminis]MBJ6724341.1 MFS transporter [Geomesophilobacter sediminis]
MSLFKLPGELPGGSSFFRFLVARAVAIVAYQMVSVAVGWQMYDITRKPLYLGMVGLVQFLPSLLLVLYTGHAADRYDRRKVISVAQSAEAAILLLLFLATWGGWIASEILFVLVFLVGVARAFEFTANQTMTPSIVSQEELPRALAIYGSVQQAAIITGPLLGGLVYAAGPDKVYGAAVILFFTSALLVSRLTIRQAPPAREPASLATIFAGFAYIRSRPVLLGAISLDLFAVLLGGATALLPIFARDILLASPQGLGCLRAAPAVGAFLASLCLARFPMKRRVGEIMFGAVACFGLATIGFALSRSLPLSVGLLAVLGGADMVSVVIRSSLVQLETPDEMRGRVSAVNGLFIGASNQLGEFESGVTAAWFGTVAATVIGGIGTLAVVAIWRQLFPQLAGRDALHGSPAEGPEEGELGGQCS